MSSELFQVEQSVCPTLMIKNNSVTLQYRVESIEALELVGASFANDKDNYDVGMAYRFSFVSSSCTILGLALGLDAHK